MTRSDALRALLAKVEAGDNPSQADWGAVFPDTPDDDDYPRSMMAVNAQVGWLDAAKALHEAVLPGWHWSIYDTDGLGKANVQVEPPEYAWEPYDGKCDNPARAWLIAVLKALIAQEDDQ